MAVDAALGEMIALKPMMVRRPGAWPAGMLYALVQCGLRVGYVDDLAEAVWLRDVWHGNPTGMAWSPAQLAARDGGADPRYEAVPAGRLPAGSWAWDQAGLAAAGAVWGLACGGRVAAWLTDRGKAEALARLANAAGGVREEVA